MNTHELKKLLSKPESATLDFKRQIYLVDSENTDAKKRHRDELIKDVLALVNGNTFTAGEIAYLVIGASNKKDTTKKRKLFDVTGHNITAQRILNWVNSACEPAVEDIVCEDIDIDGVTLLVITIPPSPHIHETIRELKPKSGKFSKYTVLVRHNEDNRIASAKERETLLQVKSYRFSERKNPPAILFGLFVGGVSGGVLSYSLSKGDIEEYDAPIVGITGMLTGSFFGLVIGSVYKNFYEIRSDWHRVPPALRTPIGIFSLIFSFVLSKIVGWLIGKKKPTDELQRQA